MRVDIYGSPSDGSAVFVPTLDSQCRRLGLSLDTTRSSPSQTPLTIVFADADSQWSEADKARFETLASNGAVVLPVIAAALDAKHIPDTLKKYNAFFTSSWGQQWPTGLTDEVLSIGWTKRRERKIFISYKRSDSQVVANQLYEALTRRQYLCFLDDISIEKGADFQNELKWWLNDADVLLVLLSPNFPASEWCMEEITFAQSRSVGLVAVDWPDSVYRTISPRSFPSIVPGVVTRPVVLDAVDPDQRLKLDDSDFAGDALGNLVEQPLSEGGLLRVLESCARQRSICIRQRIDDLVPLAKEALHVTGTFTQGKDLGDFEFTNDAGERHFVRVLPFRPDAKAVWEACQSGAASDIAGCFYSEYAVTDIRANALKWLANRPHETAGMAKQSRVWACIGDNIVE